MPTSMETHAAAVAQAQAWLRAHTPQVRHNEPRGVTVEPCEQPSSVRWRCEVAVPHPADDTMEIVAAGIGTGQEGALELALLELRGYLQRHYQEPEQEIRRLLPLREAMPYTPSGLSIDRALRCLRDRQVLDVSHLRVGAVGARVCADAHGLPVTVGDVVRKVLEEDQAADQMRLGA